MIIIFYQNVFLMFSARNCVENEENVENAENAENKENDEK